MKTLARSLLGSMVCLSLLGVSACGDHDKTEPAGAGATGAGAAAATGAGAAASGARPGTGGEADGDASSLRVEFEELALESEPTLITDFVFYPGSDTDFLALDKSGKLLRFRLGEQGATLLSSAQVDGVYDNLDCGAISLTFEPDFAQGNFVYVGSCVSQTHSEILRLDLDDELNVVSGSQVSIMNVGFVGATRPWHNVGSIGFEPGGVLWALFGEKVQGAPAQDLGVNLGKLVRIVPSREPGLGGFEPAPDGPLVDQKADAQAVYGYGLRSPFRGTLDSRGFYWVGDVGSDLFEEVNVARGPLTNFGWPMQEGPCADCGETTTPAFYWPHGTTSDYIADDPEVEVTLGRVAWAGPEILAHDPDRYGGRLAGSVLFGDFCAGFLRQGRVDDDGVPTLDAPLGHLNNAGAFRQHTDGFVYAITFGRCQTDVVNKADEAFSRMYRMLPKDP
jgi:glucose/arabinose dehydrogenase